jgi:hypothetical protein
MTKNPASSDILDNQDYLDEAKEEAPYFSKD